MYYSSGNYEAFAHPLPPEGVENKQAYIIGSGLAGLAAACFLVRDGRMPGEKIHILERDPRAGGGCDGWDYPGLGYTMRGGREMDNHFEVMWDLFRDIPSIEDPSVSVLDYYYWLNKRDPNYSLCRATQDRGQDAHTDNKFNLSDKACMEIMNLFFTPEEELQDKVITEYFSDEVLNSNFWLYWRTMFAFENWHSALEMKRYVTRFVHHLGGLPDFSALRFTRYNQYESMILPMVNYLESHGVDFQFNTHVTDVRFSCDDAKDDDRKLATEIRLVREDGPAAVDAAEGVQPDGKTAPAVDLRAARRPFRSRKTTSSSSRPAAWWPTPPSAARTPPPVSPPSSLPATAGICGRGSRPSRRSSAVPRSSAATRRRATGRAPR